jgi:hypothetical protein
MLRAVVAVALLAASALALPGCATQPKYSQAQLNAIEVRIVEASFDDTYTAAANALFDAGYIIGMSDKDAGLITGGQTRMLGFWEAMAADAPYQSLVMSIQIVEESENRCRVRVKTQISGITVVNREAVDAIWVLMQRQVLMSTPATLETPDGEPIAPPSIEENASPDA